MLFGSEKGKKTNAKAFWNSITFFNETFYKKTSADNLIDNENINKNI